MARYLEEIQLRNILSFGPQSPAVPMSDLNVIVGPNGSGKSNLIESLGLLRSAPKELVVPVREGGGVKDWLWKGSAETPLATLDATWRYTQGPQSLRHSLSFTESGHRFEVVDERIENRDTDPGYSKPFFYFGYENGRPMLNSNQMQRRLEKADIHPEKSILAQRRDPDAYPEITYLADGYEQVKLYRDWSFGRYTAPRLPQSTDLPNTSLNENADNIALVLSWLRQHFEQRQALLDDLKLLYSGIDDFDIAIEGGTAQLYLYEGKRRIPATRLSDGTLRFLCLLSIFHNPNPAPLVCIEEPELGLHPDILPRLAELLKETSQRTQLIVTTHSPILVDSLSQNPEDVLVAEKIDGSTRLERLSKADLATWLEKYSLGDLWMRGEIGGVRW